LVAIGAMSPMIAGVSALRGPAALVALVGGSLAIVRAGSPAGSGL
jgi:hypothetical protein